MAELPVDRIIKTIKEPRNLGSFYSEAINLRIKVYGREDPITLERISPFSSIYDVKIGIYKVTGIPPEHQFLARQGLSQTLFPVDYLWTKVGEAREINLVNPMNTQAVSKQSVTFVDATGERRILGYSGRLRIQFENYISQLNPQPKELYLFSYSQIKQQYPSMSERIWFGSIYPYFPLLTYGKDTIPEGLMDVRLKQYSAKEQVYARAEELISNLELLPLTCGGVRYLQFQWLTKTDTPNYIENLFYTVPVTKNLVYMRLMPNKSTPVTKFHIAKDGNPDIADVKLLKQWTKERNPTPEHDFILGKAMIRPAVAQQPPLYMTLRMYEGGTADAIVMPVRGVRKLDMFTDLERFPENFKRAIENVPFAEEPMRLASASLIYGVHLPPKSEIFNKTRMKKRLPFFSPFFTEIQALPGETPLGMLRYKCVDNYATENRIFTFLTLVSNRRLVQGEAVVGELVGMLEDEFQLDTEEAKTYVAKWFKSKGEYQLVAGDTSTFAEVNNTGIEIAIFSQHPFYSFHLYNVDSTKNLKRILTLLSLLFSASDIQVSLGSKTAATITAIEQKVEEQEAPEVEDDNTRPINESGVEPFEIDPLFAQMGDEFGGDEFGGDEFGGSTPSTPTVKELVANDTEEPREDMKTAPIVKPPTAQVVAGPAEDTTAGKEENLANYFIRRLKEADLRLFEYSKEHPSMKKYVSMCAANVTRQPAVVTRAQYEEMRDVIYKEDIDSLRINFITFPKEEKNTAKNVKGKAETFYFLRYGTTSQKYNDNYYVCAKYFCGRDNVVLIEEDYQGTTLRRPITYEDGTVKTTKAPNTCPFCEGGLIRNRERPGPNETVIQREFAPNTEKEVDGKKVGKIHEYVGFLNKAHPEGFYMPCCFIKPETIYIKSKYYDKLRDLGVDLAPGKGLDAVEDEGAMEEEAAEPIVAAKPYAELRPARTKQLYMTAVKRVITKFIVGAEKLPLEIHEEEGPQIGMLPPLLDSYFEQAISDFINPKSKDIHKLKPEAKGFLRIGVENRARFKADSFLAAIAPFYNVEDTEAMKRLIWQTLQNRPNIFLQLNYGNFLIEFYDIQRRFPTEAECQRLLEGTDTNRWEEAIQIPGFSKARQRFLCSFQSFHDWLFSDTTIKEYRQFAHLLSLPNTLLRSTTTSSVPGITFIVLKMTQDGKVEVECPAYSFNGIQNANNDVAFLLHHWSGIWEPIFYVDNRSTVEPATFLFQRAEEGRTWPDIVIRRVAEFTSMDGCYASGKFSYASRQIVNPKRMVPASLLAKRMTLNGVGFEGILRDPYNHLAALIFEDPEQENMFIPVPCVDDGFIFPTKKLYLDWKDCVTAPLDTVLDFYQENMSQFTSTMYGSFEPREVWYYVSNPKTPNKLRGFVCGLLLKNLQLIHIKSVDATKRPYQTEFVETEKGMMYKYKDTLIPARLFLRTDDLEWEINKKIVFENEEEGEEGDDEISTSTTKDLQDIYEHFRITFANWLSSAPDNSDVRKKIEDVVSSDQPLYQKRKDLQIILDSQKILSWISSEEPDKKVAPIRRVDCTKQSKGTCGGRCVWSSSDICLIHAPETTIVAKAKVNTARLFLYKLIDEILRFSEKRAELFENTISTLGFIDRDIVEGEQRIIPENTAAWYELLREDWTGVEVEKARFFEEQSRRPTKEEQLIPLNEETQLPVSLQTYLDAKDPFTATLRLLRAPMDILLSRIAFRVDKTKSSFTKEELDRIVRAVKFPLAQIDIRSDVPQILTSQIAGQANQFFILVLTNEGPALLVRDPESDELPLFTQLPVSLRNDFMKTKISSLNKTRKAGPVPEKRGIKIVSKLPTKA